MRVVVTGASGNVGTSVLLALGADAAVGSILGIARRRPSVKVPKTTWAEADVSRSDLVPLFRGADAVVHLAWRIQPSHDPAALRETNVVGSRRVFEAVAKCRVPALVYASSVGAYSPGPKTRRVDESWPTEGIATSLYSMQKVEVERLLDALEQERPALRVVRFRKALVFKREAAEEIRRYFLGRLFPRWLSAHIPVVPALPQLRFQAVHSLDAGEAYRLAVRRDVRGAFNLAAKPVLDADELARHLHAWKVPATVGPLRGLASLTWRLRLQPADPGWLDLALGVPILDVSRARKELGWHPRFNAAEALLELLGGIRDGAGIDTPPLAPARAGWKTLPNGARFEGRPAARPRGARRSHT